MATEKIMTETAPVDGGGSPGTSNSAGSPQNMEGVAPPKEAGPVEAEGQILPQPPGELKPQKPWHISPEYDLKRAKEYVVKEEGNYNVFTDPVTDKEVARVLKVAGGAEGLPEAPEGIDEMDEAEATWSDEIEFGDEELWGSKYRAERWRVVGELGKLERLTNKEKYDGGENERKLYHFYKRWKYLEELDTKKSQESKPFDPADFEQPTLVAERETYDEQDIDNIPPPEGQQTATPVGWFNEYQRLLGSSIPTDNQVAEAERNEKITQAREYLSRYFKQAHRIGLLDGVDGSLKSVAHDIQQGIDQGLPEDEIMDGVQESYSRGIEPRTGVKRRIAAIKEAGQEAFSRAQRVDPEVAKLGGVSEVYIDSALERLRHPFNSRLEQPFPIDGGFEFDAERGAVLGKMLDEGEIYWRPQYANYFVVYARTREQFDRAEETFIRWMRTGLGKDPQELIQTVDGFIKALTTAGQRLGPEMQEHAVGKRRELTALMGIIISNFFNENYKPAEMKQGWTFATQHEGPLKMLELIKTSRGIMAAVLHKFDVDPGCELLFSPHGSRGQLMGKNRNAIEMNSLQEQKLAELTAEVIGIAMKRYHPDDPEKIIDTNMYRRNLGDITKFKPDEYFEDLYEGFDLEEQERLYEELEENPVIQRIKFAKLIEEGSFIGPLTQEQSAFYQLWKSGRLVKEIESLEKNIKFARWVDAKIKNGKSPSLNRQQKAVYELYKSDELPRPSISLAELQAWERLDRVRRIQANLTAGMDPTELEGQDRIMYDEARNAVETAYELYGSMGEKAKRGGAVFLVDRQDAKERWFRDYIPNFWAERDIHFAENWTKATYGGELDEEIKARIAEERGQPVEGILAEELFYRVGQARRMATWALKYHGRDTKLWDFTLLRNGKPVDPNTLGYYPIWGIDRTKDEKTEAIERYRYALPRDPRILGYNSKGKEVILVFDEQGKPITNERTGLEFDARTSQPLIFDAEKKPILFDNLNRDTKARPMLLKRPLEITDPETDRKRVAKNGDTLGYNQNGQQVILAFKDNILAGVEFDETDRALIYDKRGRRINQLNRDTRAKQNGEIFIEELHPDFDTVTHELASHPFARWTGHPYWGYQEEDTGLVLSPAAFEAAKKIKSGQMRSQDAPPHAVQLLILDPTLDRAGHFDLENLEAAVNLAVGEESYISHWRIGDELYMNFFPPDADRLKTRVEYVLQDHGGSTKEWFHIRAQAALWPDARVRRLRTFTPFINIRFAAMSEMWGAPGGALDVFRMIGFQKYKMVGQFAMDKWTNQTAGAQKVLEAYVDWFDEQNWKLAEGLGRKLNNEADTMRKFHKQLRDGTLGSLTPKQKTVAEDEDEEFLKTFRGTLNRVEVVMNRNTVLQSVMRGERNPLNVEGIDIYQRRPDGTYLDERGRRVLNNDKIDWGRDSGSARHDNNIMLWRYVRLLRSRQKREGQALYPYEAKYYELGDSYTVASMNLAEEAREVGDPKWERFFETRFEWFNGKANN